MSTKAHRTFTREFKLELCRQVQSGQKRPAQICREHQLTEGLLLRWRGACKQRGEAAFSAKEIREASAMEAMEQKIAELERYDTRLTLAALNAAIAARRPSCSLIHHSDRDVQYASTEQVARLGKIGVSLSGRTHINFIAKAGTQRTEPPASMRAALFQYQTIDWLSS